ncbi:uncharacterized protein LOC143923396 [Lithobates pipiens]
MAKMEDITRQTFDKLRQIKDIMGETHSHRRPRRLQRRISGGQRSEHKVGIFCSEKMNISWLEEVLSSNLFNDQVRKFKCIIFKDKKNIKQEASKYTFCICLCNRRNWTNIVLPPWKDAVKILLGLRPLIVVILDANDSGEEGKRRILQNLNSTGIESRHLFLFSRAEEDTYTRYSSSKIQTKLKGLDVGTEKRKKDSLFGTLRNRFTNRSKKASRPPLSNLDTQDQHKARNPSDSYAEYTQEKPSYEESTKIESLPSFTKPLARHVVGIFSRSSSDDYSWLMELLTSNYFRTIEEVRPCYISNNGFQQFVNDLSECTLGILYHTKNRGRVNITNVNDSLYDDELAYLETMLGKDNVVVLVDDLEDRGDQKTRILENQPSIKELASDLLIITRTDKADEKQLVRKLKSIKQFCHPSENFSKRTLQEQKRLPKTSDPPPRHDIVIFSILEDSNTDWLQKLLSSEIFRHRQVTLQKISFYENGRLKERVFQCNFGIIYHNMKNGWPITSEERFLYDGVLQQMSDRNNAVVIIDYLKDSGQQKQMRNFCNQHHIQSLASELFLLLYTENDEQIKKKLKTIKQLSSSSEHSPQEKKMIPKSQIKNTNSHKTPTSKRSVIGVFTVSEEGHISWLRRLLSSDIFGQREVTYHEMPSYDDVGLEEGQIQCVAAILYHTMKNGSAVTPQGGFLYRRVTEQLVHTLGKDNVIVLIDDLQSVADKKWVMWIKSKIEKWAGDLLYITPEEKYNQERLVQGLKSLKLFRQPPEYRTRTDPVPHKLGKSNTISAPASSVIGIFSRSEKSKCSWLERLLSSKEFGNHQVVFHQISPGNLKEFQSLVSLCKFGILYHCMGRGYQYLTDQKTSLYDEELLYLSTRIGKSRVIVVIDEVGNSDKEAKSWTVESQPSLGMLARDVLLFTKSDNILQQKRNRSMHVDRRLSTVYEKLNTFKEILKEGMTSASFSNSKEDLV